MQMYVPKSQLTGAADELVTVLASYQDGVVVNAFQVPPNCTVLSLPQPMIASNAGMPVLQKGWRNDNGPQVLNFEANNRINAVFPDYSQRNANNEATGYITQYGSDSTKWPAAAQSRKAEMDRCWNYVNAVRAAANTLVLSMLPADPTDNSHWPTPISPYVPS
jgi:hypothetical protein